MSRAVDKPTSSSTFSILTLCLLYPQDQTVHSICRKGGVIFKDSIPHFQASLRNSFVPPLTRTMIKKSVSVIHQILSLEC